METTYLRCNLRLLSYRPRHLHMQRDLLALVVWLDEFDREVLRVILVSISSPETLPAVLTIGEAMLSAASEAKTYEYFILTVLKIRD